MLLVMGAAMFVGGLGPRAPALRPHGGQRRSRRCCCSPSPRCIMPAIFELVEGQGLPAPGAERVHYDSDLERCRVARRDRPARHLRRRPVLLAADPPRPLQPADEDDRGPRGEPWTVRKRGASLLAIAGVAVGVMSEILVGSISEASETIGLSPFFVGVIVVAIVGNAAEHWVAVFFAAQGQDGPGGQHRDRLERPDRAVRRAGARARLVLHRPVPDGARLQRLRAGRDPARGADRQPGHAGGRVDVVRGLQLLASTLVLGLTFFFA